jgi:hypothetical protein
MPSGTIARLRAASFLAAALPVSLTCCLASLSNSDQLSRIKAVQTEFVPIRTLILPYLEPLSEFDRFTDTARNVFASIRILVFC